MNDNTPITHEEAIKVLHRLTFYFCRESKKRSVDDTNIILRAIFIAILDIEKQIKKKPIEERITINKSVLVCQVCNECVNSTDKYCTECGQALKWND